jgi:hypothetical protein
MQVRLTDGRRYALNVWTFKFLHRARFPWPYEGTSGETAKYVVEKLDRQLLEQVALFGAGVTRREDSFGA